MSFVEAALSNEEDRLWQKVRESKDQSARNQLVEHYLPYAKQLAASLFANRPDNDVEFADYMQYASIGLIEAVDRYETTRGAMFKTFAGYRIKGAILNGVRLATERRGQYKYLDEKKKERLASISNNEKKGDENVFYELVELTVGLALGYMLDELCTDDKTISSQVNGPYHTHAYRETCMRIEQAVDKLEERERRIIQYHYYHQMNFESLADLYGLSKGRISQLHKQALNQIRSNLQGNELIDKFF